MGLYNFSSGYECTLNKQILMLKALLKIFIILNDYKYYSNHSEFQV